MATTMPVPERIRVLMEGEAHAELSRHYRAMLCQPPFERYTGESVAAHRSEVFRWCSHLASQGLGKLGLPPDMGGNPIDLLPLVQALGLFDFSLLVKFGVHFGLIQGAIARLGTEGHREWLLKTSTLELPACFAMTETDHGSNVRGLETTAVFEGGEFILHTPHPGARKDYIGSAALHGRLAIVFAQLSVGGECHGVHAFLMRIRDDEGNPMPGVFIEDCGPKMGLNGVDNGRLGFDSVRVPRENLLDRYGSVSPEGVYSSPIPGATRRFFTMVGNLVAGRITVAAAAVAGAQSGLAIALRYASRRRQFGTAGQAEMPILDYQYTQRRLLPRLSAVFAVEAGMRELLSRYARSSDDRELETFAAAIKAYASWSAVETLQHCREVCGGAGYLAVNRFAALRADLDIFTTFEGDNVVLSLLVARNLLNEFRLQFKGGSWLTGLKWLSKQVAESHRPGGVAGGLSPLLHGLSVDEVLLSGEFQSGALRFRQDRLLTALARRLRARLHRGMDPFEAVNHCQDHAVALARAYAESQLHGSLARVVSGADPEVGEVLRKVLDLFALSRLEADRGWFLEHGYLDVPRAKAVRRLVLRLCAELRPRALDLVDSFGIPSELLGAPIAR